MCVVWKCKSDDCVLVFTCLYQNSEPDAEIFQNINIAMLDWKGTSAYLFEANILHHHLACICHIQSLCSSAEQQSMCHFFSLKAENGFWIHYHYQFAFRSNTLTYRRHFVSFFYCNFIDYPLNNKLSSKRFSLFLTLHFKFVGCCCVCTL